MPSNDDDEIAPAKQPATPRRASANKRAGNNGRTPVRRTPNSAPARKLTGKKEPPTLFQDFLLGRPSPQRTGRPVPGRRKSLDAVKRDLRLGVDEVKKVQPPGAVKDRVKEWQKANARAVVVDSAASGAEDDSPEKTRIQDGKKRPGRRKSKEAEDVADKWRPIGALMTNGQGISRKRSKSAAAPKKRVISDEHWMKKDSTPRKGAPIPKNFLEKTVQNPTPKKKIEDWVKMNAKEDLRDEIVVDVDDDHSRPTSAPTRINTPRRSKPGKQVETVTRGSPLPKDFLANSALNPTPGKKMEDWFKRNESEMKSDETPNSRVSSRHNDLENTPTKTRPSRGKSSPNEAFDDGIRVRPSKSSNATSRVKSSPNLSDDGIRIKPSRENSFTQGDDGIRIKPSRPKKVFVDEEPETKTPRKRSEKHLKPPVQRSRDEESQISDGESWTTPSRGESRRKHRKSGSPSDSLSEIPFGNSAFSVLDLPLGAEAGSMRKPAPPRRNPSFGVPKVLKKVYTEAKNIVHETVDPARTGPNQPPSIESWLNQTSDPFVDRPRTPKSNLSVPKISRRRSYKEDDTTEQSFMAKVDPNEAKRKKIPSAHNVDVDKESYTEDLPTPKASRETLPSMENSSPPTPSAGLRRRAATRNASSPKSEKKTPLKEVLLDAFRGESAAYKSRSFSLGDSSFREKQSPLEPQQGFKSIPEEISSPPIPTIREPSSTLEKNEPVKALPTFPRRLAPTTGQHRLSTIASVETFSTYSGTGTESDISQATVTHSQSSVSTNPTLSTLSTLSRDSHKSSAGNTLKRRLTKHSDLMSVLSLPDTTAPPGRAASIRSARSLRTNRTSLETATLQDLMQELATDEAKYMRELKTLVDGVIPVLLTCVLSKSDSAIAAGLFASNCSHGPDPSFTKPIVDMGVALERLKSLHNRIPLADSAALVFWLERASKTYDDYLTAWRMGFQDVVVNLAPVSPAGSAAQSPNRDEMPLNANGDVVKEDGERVDVAFLLKRPLVRVKYLSKVAKGMHKLGPTEVGSKLNQRWEELESRSRRRTREEGARMVDRVANNTDTTRARDPETLALAEDVKIDQTRQVCAKDNFELDMWHSSGQRVECEVELLLRDKPSDKNDPGDVLICAVDEVKKWLLFPPVTMGQISARIGDSAEQVVVMIRGDNWEEILLLTTDDEAASEWVDMLGKTPIPPTTIRDDVSIVSRLATSILPTRQPSRKETDIAIPIGERRRREAEEVVANKDNVRSRGFSSQSILSLNEDFEISDPSPKDLNEAMKRAGKPFTATKHARARYHSRGSVLAASPASRTPSRTDDHVIHKTMIDQAEDKGCVMSGGLPYIPEVIERDDGAPPPPAHGVNPPSLKKSPPVMEGAAPKSKHRRTSSPLKHEYQPSNASGTSSSSEVSDSDNGSFSDSSEDEELEGAELPELKPSLAHYPKRSPSIYSLPNTTLAPSNSASQTPYRGVPVQRDANGAKRLVATISAWGGDKWVDLHPGPCSIVVSPGLIEAFEMNASHSSPNRDAGFENNLDSEANLERPLIAQVLTPVVNLRQSTAVDIEIKSPVTSNSLLKANSATIRYRTYTVPACLELYAHIHRARCSNPVYEKLAQERMVNSYGTHSYEAAVAGNRRRSFFGRRKSYRASERAPASDDQSHSSSTFSRLRRKSGGGIFNLSKSTVLQSNGASQYTDSSRTSIFSGPTPPRTPSNPSLTSTMTSGNVASLGNKDLKIRLYILANSTQWDDQGPAFLDVTLPLPGMRQRSSLYTGIERRIVVRKGGVGGEEGGGVVVLDEVLGAGCFQQLSRTGIVVNVWEDVVGDNGEIGTVGKTGGVSGRTRKWMFQMVSAAERNWIYSLCAAGR